MYRSPIRIDYITRTSELISDIAESISGGVEKNIIAKVQTIVDVDKEELIKALAYDRNQYEKGYKEGFRAAIEKIENYLEVIEEEAE